MSSTSSVTDKTSTFPLYVDLHIPTTAQRLRFAIAIIIALGGLAAAITGVYAYLGSLGNLSQFHAIIMMATGSALFVFVSSLIGYVKWSQKS